MEWMEFNCMTSVRNVEEPSSVGRGYTAPPLFAYEGIDIAQG